MSPNIIEASWQALSDSIVYGLLHVGRTARPRLSSLTRHELPLSSSPSIRSTSRGPTRRPTTFPTSWKPDRPAELAGGRQPEGERLGYQGPDQGYGLVIADRFKDRLQLQRGEHADDAIQGCLGVALRRASIFGRAPVIHDFTIAFTVWGFLDADPPGRAASSCASERVRQRRRTTTPRPASIADGVPGGDAADDAASR